MQLFYRRLCYTGEQMNSRLLLIILFFLFAAGSIFAQLPAFPGALGWGNQSVGGRGGIVLQVTNLNDSGPGSLRDAISTPGARTIVFLTGGVINLQSELQIVDPYVYIAGQTAPGDGIVLKNFPLAIFTHDIIIRGLRIRIGNDFPNQSPDNRDCITLESGAQNIVLDHCSFSWALDENVSAFDSTAQFITVQWCIISEALYKSVHPKGPHGMGLLIGNGTHKTSVHHNLLAHNADRNPLVKGQTDHEFVNNIIYDWKYSNGFYEDGEQLKADIVGNYYKPLTYSPFPELPLAVDFDSTTTFGSRLFIQNNVLSPNLFFLTQAQISNFAGDSVLFSNTSLLSSSTTLTYQTPSAAYDTILNWAGALHPQRDTVDKRVLQSVRDSTGGLIDCVDAVPIFLDSGNVISATDSSFTYSVLTDSTKYSADGRQIVITGGTGAGQVRNGVYTAIINAPLQIVEGFIDTNWAIIPDSTSTYKFFAACQNNVGGWPVYNTGIPPLDSDNDGMPDAWELAHGLNPSDSSDHNGLNLSGQGYTNLEVYLNEFYLSSSNTAVQDIANETGFTIHPNPCSSQTTLHLYVPVHNATLTVYNCFGQAVAQIKNIGGQTIIFSRDNLASGLYLLYLTADNKIYTNKLIITDK